MFLKLWSGYADNNRMQLGPMTKIFNLFKKGRGPSLGPWFFIFALGCQPTNTRISKKSAESNGSSNQGLDSLQVLRITDASNSFFSGAQQVLPIGQTLSLKAALYSTTGVLVGPVEVQWRLRTMSGSLSSGLSCEGTVSSTCDFTPVAPGSVYVEITVAERTSTLLSANDSSNLIVVTGANTPNTLSLLSGNNQIGTVDSNLSAPVRLQVKDAFNRPVPGEAISVAMTSGGGQVVSTNPHVTDSNGDILVQLKMGTAAGNLNNQFLATVNSNPALTQNIYATAFPGNAHHLSFQTSPAGTYSLLPWSVQPVVTVQDSFNNTVQTTEAIVASVKPGTGNGVLSGNLTKSVIGGSATFTDISYSLAEANVEIQFTSSLSNLTLTSTPMNFTLPSGVSSAIPNDVDFGWVVTDQAGVAGRSTSSAVTVAGLGENVGVSVSGPGNPRLRLNGGGEQTALLNVANGDTLMVVADAPMVSGTVNVVSVAMGGRSESWEVRYIDSTRVAYAFVTAGSLPGAMGGLTGADAYCQTSANNAGYFGTWMAVLTDSTMNLKSRIPWDWASLRRIDGALIANGWSDLWDGTVVNPINIDENGGTRNISVSTGVTDALSGAPSTDNCSNFNSGSSSLTSAFGSSSLVTGGWLSNGSQGCNLNRAFYCISNPSSASDNTPTSFSLKDKIVTTPGARVTANSVTIKGINKTVAASLTGTEGNPKLVVNGGAEVGSYSGLRNGDVVQVVMDAPATSGLTHTVTLTLGTLSADWKIRYADSNNTAMIFVTSSNFGGRALGSINNANIQCQNLASRSGFSGTWMAMITDRNFGDLSKRIPWNWGTLRRPDGAIVATSWDDLWDGTLVNPINVTEARTTRSTEVWTGVSHFSGTGSVNSNDDVNYWNSAGVDTGRVGSSISTTGPWISGPTLRDGGFSLALYCISDPILASDSTPDPLSFLKEVASSAGARRTSNSVLLSGIGNPVTVSVSGVSGNPMIKINGGSEVASGLAGWGDTVQVVMDAPTTLGTMNTATITLGGLVTTWNVGYADATKTARVFVSNTGYTGNLGGLAGADAKCNQEALAAGYTAGTWKALLSDSATNARDRLPYNWGHLKLVNGTPVADSWQELWSGTLQNSISLRADGASLYSGPVFSSTNSEGQRQSLASLNSDNCNNWSSTGAGSVNLVFSGHSGGNTDWISGGLSGNYCYGAGVPFYCVEDTSAGNDWSPDVFSFTYKTFQPLSTRVTSNVITISGIPGTPAPVTLTGTQGNPSFKINGGPEVTSGSVKNGDTLALVMDTPAAFNQSHKVEVQVGTGALVPWRLWTGDTASGVKKRMFITSTSNLNGNLSGLGGADIICQNAAANNTSLNGMTWKALISGVNTTESGWAINRIGYDWSELWTFNSDGSFKNKIFSASGIWTDSGPEASFNLNEMGVVISSGLTVLTNTKNDGTGLNSSVNSCVGYTNSATGATSTGLINGPAWLNGGSSFPCSTSVHRLYCIQQ